MATSRYMNYCHTMRIPFSIQIKCFLVALLSPSKKRKILDAPSFESVFFYGCPPPVCISPQTIFTVITKVSAPTQMIFRNSYVTSRPITVECFKH